MPLTTGHPLTGTPQSMSAITFPPRFAPHKACWIGCSLPSYDFRATTLQCLIGDSSTWNASAWYMCLHPGPWQLQTSSQSVTHWNSSIVTCVHTLNTSFPVLPNHRFTLLLLQPTAFTVLWYDVLGVSSAENQVRHPAFRYWLFWIADIFHAIWPNSSNTFLCMSNVQQNPVSP